jgi:hypothetical protein
MVNGLTLSSAEIYNPTSGTFAVASGSLPQSSVGMALTLLRTSRIAPGGTLNCHITFKPQALGPVSAASLTNTDNASNSPQKVKLTGTGKAK